MAETYNQKDLQAIEQLYNEASNTGTLAGQESVLAELAQEVGTTKEALEKARHERNIEAAKQFSNLILPELEEVATHGNARDNWRYNKSN